MLYGRKKLIYDRRAEEVSESSETITYGPNGEIEISSDKITIGRKTAGSAQLVIGSDGSISINAPGGKGLTLGSSSSGLTLLGKEITIEGSGKTTISAGAFNLSSKSDISISAPTDAGVTLSGGSFSGDFTSMFTKITGDYLIGLSGRYSIIASDMTVQSSAGILFQSLEAFKVNTNGFAEIHAGKHMSLLSNERMQINSKSQMELNSEGLLALYSHGGSIIGRAGQSIGLNAHGTFYAISTLAQISSKGEMSIRADGLLSINSDGSDIKIASNANVLISGASKTQIYGSEVDIDSSGEIHMQMGHATKVDPLSAIDVPDQKQSNKDGENVQAPEAADAPTKEVITSALSSKLDQPDASETGASSTGEVVPAGEGTDAVSTPAGGGTPTSGSGNPGSGSPNPSYTPSTYQRPSNPGPRSGAGKLYAGPEDSWNGVDQKLKDIYDCGTPKFEQATGYKVTMFSGRRPRPNNPNSYHPKGQAFDVYITDGCGKKLDNFQSTGDNKAFAAYELYAHYLRQCQLQLYPNMPFRWGGYFTDTWMDSMHFDNGGNSMGAGSWNSGLYPQFSNAWNINSSAGYGSGPDPSRVPKGCQEEASNQTGDDTWIHASEGTVVAAKANEQGDPVIYKVETT